MEWLFRYGLPRETGKLLSDFDGDVFFCKIFFIHTPSKRPVYGLTVVCKYLVVETKEESSHTYIRHQDLPLANRSVP